jgi:hypothetical protein
VLEVVDKIANEDGLSLSKACALLIEEALETRGLLDKSKLKNDRWTSTTVQNKKSETPSLASPVTTDEVSAEDLALLKKLKLLKELGL